MSDCMKFPDSVDEFMEEYKMIDTKHIYSNGTEYVPIFRMKQWFERLPSTEKTGKWIRTAGEYIGDDISGFYDYHWSCSECEREAIINDWNMYELSDYCPNCGAKMEDE